MKPCARTTEKRLPLTKYVDLIHSVVRSGSRQAFSTALYRPHYFSDHIRFYYYKYHQHGSLCFYLEEGPSDRELQGRRWRALVSKVSAVLLVGSIGRRTCCGVREVRAKREVVLWNWAKVALLWRLENCNYRFCFTNSCVCLELAHTLHCSLVPRCLTEFSTLLRKPRHCSSLPMAA